jgi:GntR family transcriptional regulator
VIHASLPERVADDVRHAITSGAYPDGRLPAEPVLAQQLGVSKATVRHAVSILEQEGLVSRRQGAGTFVVGRALELNNNLSVNFGVTELIESAGFTAGTKDALARIGYPDEKAQQALGIAATTDVIVLQRTRTADGRVVARTTDTVTLRQFVEHGLRQAEVVAHVTHHQSLYRALLEIGIQVKDGVAELVPWRADARLGEELGIKPGALLLRLDQTDFDLSGAPVVFSTEFFLADSFKFQVYRKGRGGERRGLTPRAPGNGESRS